MAVKDAKDAKLNESPLPKNRTVHGIKIERLTLGSFISAIETLDSSPMELIAALFPQGAAQQLAMASAVEGFNFMDWYIGLLTRIPRFAISLAARLMLADEERLNELGFNEFLDVVAAWMELNEIVNFIDTMRSIMKMTEAGECMVLSRQDFTSAYPNANYSTSIILAKFLSSSRLGAILRGLLTSAKGGPNA